ncbi:MAG TPA: quinone-dependent dihydroorotate dehydrogenase [Puia sp.]|nr:quinone-dependent dihydroorotate dehydrogenase [Puia sp.]
MYTILRKLLFLFPPESVHHFSMFMLRIFCRIGFLRNLIKKLSEANETDQSRRIFGLRFRNWIGLGAGFDKNARYLAELDALGFGFVEIGTVTPEAQPGNEKPRLFRLPMDRALINRMGFNNDGVKIVAERLMEWRSQNQNHEKDRIIIGGNIGKNKVTPNEDAWMDYEKCFRSLFPWVDYFVVNVSSPNTPGLRELQEKGALRKILSHLQTLNHKMSAELNNAQKPILLKIAPDLTTEQLNDIIDLAAETNLAGLVATNTTIGRDNLLTPAHTIDSIGAGGLSGHPLKEKSNFIQKYIHEKTHGKLAVIASGGIFNAEDAREKIQAGATLIQVWTGFIYEGPFIVKHILDKFRKEKQPAVAVS